MNRGLGSGLPTPPLSNDLCWPEMQVAGWWCDTHGLSWPHEELRPRLRKPSSGLYNEEEDLP